MPLVNACANQFIIWHMYYASVSIATFYKHDIEHLRMLLRSNTFEKYANAAHATRRLSSFRSNSFSILLSS